MHNEPKKPIKPLTLPTIVVPTPEPEPEPIVEPPLIVVDVPKPIVHMLKFHCQFCGATYDHEIAPCSRCGGSVVLS